MSTQSRVSNEKTREDRQKKPTTDIISRDRLKRKHIGGDLEPVRFEELVSRVAEHRRRVWYLVATIGFDETRETRENTRAIREFTQALLKDFEGIEGYEDLRGYLVALHWDEAYGEKNLC